MSVPWWKTAVVYHVYPRSFLDTDRAIRAGDPLPCLRRIVEALDAISRA